MNEVLKDRIRIIADDDLTLQAIKMLAYERIEKEKPQVSESIDDKVIGQKYRAYNKAREIFDELMIDFSSYKSVKKDQQNFNKAK